MSNHASAGPESKHLCERLFEELEKRLGPLLYRRGQEMCTVRNETGVIACVNSHAQAYGSINIWFRGNAGKDNHFRALHICSQSKSNAYGGSFKIRTEEQLLEAVDFLATISARNGRNSQMNLRIKAPAKTVRELKLPGAMPRQSMPAW